MVNINPIIYRVTASTCGSLIVLPLDIISCQILYNKKFNININEIKFILYSAIIFCIQNTVYSLTINIKNNILRGILSGIAATPLYYILETDKIKSRINIYPIKYRFFLLLAIREIILYTVLYNIIIINIPFAKFIASVLANTCGFPIKFIAQKHGYPNLNIKYKYIKNIMLIEILKSSINDVIILYLIYNIPFSPFYK
jgi:hypothetical protein